ncbi:unnamed protein product [Ostreobium quekettii]|uniref:Alpha-1,3-glucosyltransferase n=1 Tax=Ostreobium quekettii TaxID=121088 RepID=A0A8S1JBF4_9CHLO|nr:unnamed protein product [Ostreobium quekettii]|eukprot:evm.model.scf_219.7 EVM.evm.TU.scf_219.7   scf_219:61422-68587(-)
MGGEACSPGWQGVVAVVGAALLVRFAVGLGPYSGMGNHPKYGDYEAQRHWMEITVNLPVSDWYWPTSDNRLEYWGIDYPPLSAFQSWLYGHVLRQFDPDMIALKTSEGYETSYSKLLMRWSVVVTDVLVMFPAAFAAMRLVPGASGRGQIIVLSCLLLQPAAVIIDHGHFQYNSLSLGLALGGAIGVVTGRHVLGSVLFCLALNHKHMTLYYAPAFFSYLLGCSLRQKGPVAKVVAVSKCGLAVLGTFLVCWLPFMMRPGGTQQLLRRLFPIERGVFEDYVANFWCASAVLFKWKSWMGNEALMKACGLATLLALLPSMLHQIRWPSSHGFMYSMANSALAFFLFSYQVHEKSILLVLMPISLLVVEEPLVARMAPMVAMLSMYPLLERDGLALQYVALSAAFLCLPLQNGGPRKSAQPPAQSRTQRRKSGPQWTGAGWQTLDSLEWATASFVIFAALVLHAGRVAVPPPSRYPFIHDAAIVWFCCPVFLMMMCYLNFKQLTSLRA